VTLPVPNLGSPFTEDYALPSYLSQANSLTVKPSTQNNQWLEDLTPSNRDSGPVVAIARPYSVANPARYSALSAKDWRCAFQNQRGWFEREMPTEASAQRSEGDGDAKFGNQSGYRIKDKHEGEHGDIYGRESEAATGI
jgi:hypothetical protein